MADVTERMLALLSILQTRRAIGGDELARRLQVSRRTLRRDVDRLRGYGYPVETRSGPGGFYRLASGRSMPPLVLDDEEAVAVLLGLGALAATGPAEGGLDDAATRAYGKLDQFLPARLRPRVAAIRSAVETSALQAPSVSAELLGTVAEAIARCDTLTFDYVDAQGSPTSRRVEPYRQVHHLLRWYLLGWDVDREDWRVFRLDRVRDLLRTGRRFAPRRLPAGSATEYLRQGLRQGRTPVHLDVAASATHVADALKYQDAEIRPTGDDRTEVHLAVESWQWLVLALATLDADVRMRADPEIVRACAVFADRLRAAAQDAVVPSEDGAR
ncbi:YafY family transcriptional regulator [Rhodococcus pyridinivorans]|uniref:helix-turn-helix transcriptional regulator n=1 Tax=Rhodococcus pyridinivorans TaxID=103816 RepID=UPI001E2D0997|nr:YafY family protein [Rhodococcus pyridinivorans]MCD5419962.1 YafY family transcriptional regulator [Rhodococcus pyridinivorans]